MTQTQAFTFDKPTYLGKIPKEMIPDINQLRHELDWESVRGNYSKDTVRTYNSQRKECMLDIWEFVKKYGASSISGFKTETLGHSVDSGLWWHKDNVHVLAIGLYGAVEWIFDPSFNAEQDRTSSQKFSIVLEEGDVLWSPTGIWHRVKSLSVPAYRLGCVFIPGNTITEDIFEVVKCT